MKRPITISELREYLGVEQAAIARHLNVAPSTVCRIEGRENPELASYDRVLAAMGARLLLVAVVKVHGRPREFPLRVPGDRRPTPEREPPPPPDLPVLDDAEPLAFPDLSAF